MKGSKEAYQCPHCKTPIKWNEDFPCRPFCSERCKLIDFGDWADEKNKISSDMVENPEDFIDSEFPQ
jgi:endogenous inhibitor of DNA gyrase (YacG/DUF329 family)